MANCPKCNAPLDEGAKFCASCGEKLEAAAPQTEAPKTEAPKAENIDVSAKLQELNNTADFTADMDSQDINDNKIMAVLAYLGWLVLIPILAAPKSRYARFHANQGLVLFLAGFVIGIVAIIPILGWLVSFVGGIATFVLMILGIINAATGKAKQLPIIGKITILK